MPTALGEKAIEKSSYTIVVTFVDEADAPVVPNAGLTWTLTDAAGTVINSRSNVALVEASTVKITLTGDDLAIGDNGNKRILTIQGTYDSDLGTDLALRDQAEFYIDDLLIVG